MAGNAFTQPVKQNPDSTPAKTFPFAVLSRNFVVFSEDFPRARRNTGQGNACQGKVGHSPDTHSLDKAVLANLGVLRVEPAAIPSAGFRFKAGTHGFMGSFMKMPRDL
jgi:hypothetical protein